MITFASPSARVLITGGSNGIGLGLAERFLLAGATVLVTGRKADQLDRVRTMLPGVRTFANDIGQSEAREALAAHVRETMPDINVLINNAGIQRRVSLADDDAPWSARQAELDILLAGPIHLNHLLVPRMLAHGRESLIVNVTSGGAFLPQPFAPVYSACKAALHSYTVNLRFALIGTNIRVTELIPPAVSTQLAGAGATHGAPLDDFCNEVFATLTESGQEEIGYGMTATDTFNEPKALYRAMFERFSSRFPVGTYAESE
ncbi:SDR family oxidoreductase [Beijerinckia sp. L45]|uniref:SDR family oxidoreductase n=1 Tax=Beijerinckia sp. L45 TaxID=1641855 RepID=UPI00131D7B6B|nr:SDR family NAD(P)-dependent oxidoreductase [Beijerinckia sp. L45]